MVRLHVPYMENHMPQASYCIDITVGYDEKHMEELIILLKGLDKSFGATKAQRGRMDDLKKLRVWTPYANDVKGIIGDLLQGDDENEYEIHFSEVDARRSMNWLPDYNHPLGDKEFNLDPKW